MFLTLTTDSYLSASISIPDFGNKVIRLYFNDSLKVNQRNEIANGGLNLYPTDNKVILKDSLLPKNLSLKLLNNRPSLFGSLLLLEEAKSNNNKIYHEIRALALKSPNEIREINLKLNAFLAYLKDKATLMDKILKNYEQNLIFKDINLKLVQEKKQTSENVDNLQEFLRRYDSYYKNDYAQEILKYLPDEPSNNLELACYYELLQSQLDQLQKEKEEEKVKAMKLLDEDYQEKLGKLGAFPANMKVAELKIIDDKMDVDVLKLGIEIDKKYEKLKGDLISKFQKLENKIEVK